MKVICKEVKLCRSGDLNTANKNSSVLIIEIQLVFRKVQQAKETILSHLINTRCKEVAHCSKSIMSQQIQITLVNRPPISLLPPFKISETYKVTEIAVVTVRARTTETR